MLNHLLASFFANKILITRHKVIRQTQWDIFLIKKPIFALLKVTDNFFQKLRVSIKLNFREQQSVRNWLGAELSELNNFGVSRSVALLMLMPTLRELAQKFKPQLFPAQF